MDNVAGQTNDLADEQHHFRLGGGEGVAAMFAARKGIIHFTCNAAIPAARCSSLASFRGIGSVLENGVQFFGVLKILLTHTIRIIDVAICSCRKILSLVLLPSGIFSKAERLLRKRDILPGSISRAFRLVLPFERNGGFPGSIALR
jgi:hypothetical protein